MTQGAKFDPQLEAKLDAKYPTGNAPVKNEYMTPREVGILRRCSNKTLQRERLDGNGPPFVRASKSRILYRRSDVDAWLADRTYKHRSDEAVANYAAA